MCVCVYLQSINAKVKTAFNKYMVKQKRELKSRFVTQQEKKKGSSRLRLLRSKSAQEVKIFHRIPSLHPIHFNGVISTKPSVFQW